jgi:hypothetical protein
MDNRWRNPGPGYSKLVRKRDLQRNFRCCCLAVGFYAHFRRISGAKLPERALDGQSMIPVIETGKMDRDKPLLWIFYDAINEHRVAMRTDDWKILARMKNDTTYLPLIHNLYEGNEELVKQAHLVDFELYNMNEDIEEAENVAEKYPEQFEEMKKLVKIEYSKLLEGSYVWSREVNMGAISFTWIGNLIKMGSIKLRFQKMLSLINCI